jgi:hypothetical protein
MRGLSRSTVELITYARRLLAESNPMTLRQLHYAIFSRREIPYENDQAAYKRLSRATTAARRNYRRCELDAKAYGHESFEARNAINPKWMVDQTRAPKTVSCWHDVGEYVDAVKRSYRRDNWERQPYYVEVWSEKATILGSIRPVTERWGVTTRVLHGFGSAGMEHDAGQLFEHRDSEKLIAVFFLGDHDPSGRVIEQDIHRRVEAAGVPFELTRLAIHAEDIAAFNLPPQKIKATDSRAAGFRRAYGDEAATVELDALPPDELRRRIDVAIGRLVDHEQWSRDLAVQELEYSTIADIVGRVKAAMPEASA